MEDGGKREKFTACSNVSRTILFVVNLMILGFGIFVIYGGAQLVKIDWFNDLGTDVYDVNVVKNIVSWVVIASGIIIILISLLGFYAAYKGDGTLGCWNVALFLVLVIIIILAVVGWTSFGFNQYFKSLPYPNQYDDDISSDFNDGYCKAQVVGLCYSTKGLVNLASSSDLLPADIKTAVTTASSVLKDMTLQEACKIPLLSQISSDISSLCDKCTEYQQYDALLKFANDQCPLNPSTTTYCAATLLSVGNAGGETPYQSCRPVLVSKWQTYSLALAIPATIVVVLLITAMILACTIRKQETDHVYVDTVETIPPHVNQYNGVHYD